MPERITGDVMKPFPLVLLVLFVTRAPLAAQVAPGLVADPNAGLLIEDVLGIPPEPLTRDAIEAADYDGRDLPRRPSPITVKVQLLLDRAGISPGVIDGRRGGMSESALRAFELREGLVVDGILDPDVWERLGGPSAGPILADHAVTAEDSADLTPDIPDDYAEKAELSALGYRRVSERLAERFHMDEDFLIALNPEADFGEGETVTVAAVGAPLEAEVARIEVRKGTGRLAAFDPTGRMIANYPVTVGSEDSPSPEGRMEVVAVAFEPTYHYDPDVNFQQGDNDEPLTLPAGPNNPVGSIWIDLSRPTYGLHGTPEPDGLFEEQSHGCVRLTNWDAEELGGMVMEGTVVEFVE
jgi:lipoprotein-anchoring transpeptidase ErfK/SrfK